MSHFIHRLEVRFRDCDPLGHANNAVYLTYLEQARFNHWRSLWGFGTPQLAARHARRHPRPRRVRLQAAGDYGETLEIRLTVAEIGRSSFRYEYEIVDDEGRTVLTRRRCR